MRRFLYFSNHVNSDPPCVKATSHNISLYPPNMQKIVKIGTIKMKK